MAFTLYVISYHILTWSFALAHETKQKEAIFHGKKTNKMDFSVCVKSRQMLLTDLKKKWWESQTCETRHATNVCVFYGTMGTVFKELERLVSNLYRTLTRCSLKSRVGISKWWKRKTASDWSCTRNTKARELSWTIGKKASGKHKLYVDFYQMAMFKKKKKK